MAKKLKSKTPKDVQFFTGEMNTARLDRMLEQGLISMSQYRKSIGLTKDGGLPESLGINPNSPGVDPRKAGVTVESDGGIDPRKPGVTVESSGGINPSLDIQNQPRDGVVR